MTDERPGPYEPTYDEYCRDQEEAAAEEALRVVAERMEYEQIGAHDEAN